jgi:site-specific recombinase XerD
VGNLRHDLHALSLLFQYGAKHNWCKTNPIREVENPSDRASRAANERGMPLAILASIMGHANLRSIMKYVHTSQEQMNREMIRLDSRPAAGPLSSGANGEQKGNSGNEREASQGAV